MPELTALGVGEYGPIAHPERRSRQGLPIATASQDIDAPIRRPTADNPGMDPYQRASSGNKRHAIIQPLHSLGYFYPQDYRGTAAEGGTDNGREALLVGTTG